MPNCASDYNVEKRSDGGWRVEQLMCDRADAGEVVGHRLLLDLTRCQVAADRFILQEVLQEHPQHHSLLTTLPHKQPSHARDSDVVSVVDPRFPKPLFELLDGDVRGELAPDSPEGVGVVLDFELEPPEEHPK